MYASAFYSRQQQRQQGAKSAFRWIWRGLAASTLLLFVAALSFLASRRGSDASSLFSFGGGGGTRPLYDRMGYRFRRIPTPALPSSARNYWLPSDLLSASSAASPDEEARGLGAATVMGGAAPAAPEIESPPADTIVEPEIPRPPPRNASWVPEQRPLPPEFGERSLTSHVFEELSLHSMSPPAPLLESAPYYKELRSRLVIAIGCGVHGGNFDISKGIDVLPLVKTLLSTFLPTAQPHHLYRFYFAFDHNDQKFEREELRNEVTDRFMKAIAAEDATRWHRPGYVAGTTVDDTTLVATMHWVHCDYRGKPAWAHSDAMMAAFNEGADYAMRTNDDTKLPETKDWVDRFIIDLRERKPISNLGVVGPSCEEGAKWILTHDFTHRTHAVIFGYHYPRSLPNWSSDDWITLVYQQFNAKLMSRRYDASVSHTLSEMRYYFDGKEHRLAALNQGLKEGAETIVTWAREAHGVTLTYNFTERTCC